MTAARPWTRLTRLFDCAELYILGHDGSEEQMSGDGDENRVQTVETAFGLIETIRSMEGARVTELAAELDLAKSTVHRHVTTLHGLGYLVRDGDQYDVSLRFLGLGEYARRRTPAFATLQSKVVDLAERTDESAQFLAPEHDRAVYVYRETGRNAVDTPNSRIGESIPLYATAAGKAILAAYPPETVASILDRIDLDPITDSTITDRATLRAELEDIQETGYSVNSEENVTGVYAVGVPVRRPDGGPIGALSVSGPARRLRSESSERDLADLLLEVANELELNIAYA
jgi:DNA-binding IclR family transcriptional regulator